MFVCFGRDLRGYLCVLGGFLCLISLGNFYTLGNMGPYISSYIRSKVDTGSGHSKLVWITAASKLGQGSSMWLGGYLCKRFGSRVAATIGCAFYCGFVALTTVTIDIGFELVVLTYGFFAYLGVGIAYVAPVHEAMRWFPNKKGLANGFVLSGYGLSAMIFSPLQTYILNPLNKPPAKEGAFKGYFEDKDLLLGVKEVFWKLAVIYATIAIVGVCLLFQAPEKPRAPTITESREKLEMDDLKPELQDLSIKKVVWRKEFYMIWFTFALSAVVVEFVNTYYKSYGLTFIYDDRFLSIVGALASVCNCGGRIAWGFITDRSTYKFSMLSILICLAVFTQAFVGAQYIPDHGSAGSKAFFAIMVILIYFSFSGVFSILPTATASAFGPTYASLNYGVLYTAPAVGSVLGAFLIEYVVEALRYQWSFTAIAATSVLGMTRSNIRNLPTGREVSYITFGALITCFMPWNLESIRAVKEINSN